LAQEMPVGKKVTDRPPLQASRLILPIAQNRMSELPNQNLFRLERAENLASEVVQTLAEIETGGFKEYDDLKYRCIAAIKDMQIGSLLDLRKAVEDE